MYVLNYVNGYYINFGTNQINTTFYPGSRSDPHSIAVFSGSQNSKSWLTGDSLSSLVPSSGRSSRAVNFSSPSGGSPAASQISSIASLRTLLKARQDRIDEEARIRREEAAKNEAARQAEIIRKAEARRAQLAASGFSSKGLKNEDLLANIFLGDFEALPFARDDMSFSALYGAYTKTFGERCSISKAAPNVEIMERYCSAWTERRNGYGMYLGTTCNEYSTRGTGVFLTPEMWDGRSAIDRAQASKLLNPKSGGGLLGGILQSLVDFTSGKTLNDMSNAIDVATDVEPLFSLNACDSAGLKRFHENLKRFALNESPVVEPSPSEKTKGSPIKTESTKPVPVNKKPTVKKPTTKPRPKKNG